MMYQFFVRFRWWLLALAFLSLNGYGLFQILKRLPAHSEVQVRQLPAEIVASGSRDVLRWHFSAPMVPVENPVEISPHVDGVFTWIAPDELVFEPAEAWCGCSCFTALLCDGLRSQQGVPLRTPSVFPFRSEPLRLMNVSQTDYSNDRVRLVLEFSDGVAMEELKEHLKITTPQGTQINYSLRGSHIQKSHSVELYNVSADEVHVSIAAGLTSLAGPLGLAQAESRKVKLSRSLVLVHLSPRSVSFGRKYIDASFNLPLEVPFREELVRVEPDVPISVAAQGHNTCRIWGDFEARKNYTLTFGPELKSAQGRSMTAETKRTVYFPDVSPAVEFVARGTYLSPRGGLVVPLRMINSGKCRATITRIYPNNLVQLVARQSHLYSAYYGSPHAGLGRVLGTVDVDGPAKRNAVVERNLALRSVLNDQTGVFHIELDPVSGRAQSHYVVVSDIGLSVRQSDHELLVWGVSLRTAEPLAGTNIKIYSPENQLLAEATANAKGIVRFDTEALQELGKPFIVTAELDNDITFLPLNGTGIAQSGSIGSRPYPQGYEAYLYADREIYRPGETAHLKVIVRDAKAIAPEPFPIKLEIYRPDGKIDRVVNAMPTEYGTAEFNILWPDFYATGKYQMKAVVPGSGACMGQISVALEEFVPPQIRVRVETAAERLSADQPLKLSVASEHLFGRPAAGLSALVRVDFVPQPFAPVAWPGYVFGDARRSFETVQQVLDKKVLNEAGCAEMVTSASTRWRPPAALKAVVSGTVTEVSGRSVTAYVGREVDVYPFYFGVCSPDETLVPGQAGLFKLATVLPGGSVHAATQKVTAVLETVTWVSVLKEQNGTYCYDSCQLYEPMEEYPIELVEGRAVVSVTPPRPGEYCLSVSDPVSGSASSIHFYVGSERQVWTAMPLKTPDAIELSLDKPRYVAGDTAILTVKAPFAGRLLFTLETDRMLDYQTLELTNNTTQIMIPVGPECRPNAYCSVSVIRPVLHEAIWGHHRAHGRVALRVGDPSRKLAVEMQLPEKIVPGTVLKVPLRVRSSDGAGCRAEVTVAAVDEGICMLTDLASPNPFAFFFAPRKAAVKVYDLYAQLMPETEATVEGTPSAPGGDRLAAIQRRLNPIQARRFKPVALWQPTLLTDEDGTTCAVFEVPEFAGELRFMAVATDQSRCGSTEKQVKVARPLTVQSSLPRFLAPEDEIVMPVTVYNQTGADGEVEVTVSCSGPLVCLDASQRVALASDAQTNLFFRMRAGDLPGRAICRLQAQLGTERHEESTEIAVRPPAGLMVYFGSGTVTTSETQSVEIPFPWLKTTGKAEICCAALPTVKLAGSLEYLMSYPYGCLEQTSSGVLPLFYLPELAGQLRPDWVGTDSVAELVRVGLGRMLALQRAEGSFSFWPAGETYEWGSIYATHVLLEATRAGYDVPKSRLEEALVYLEKIISRAVSGRVDNAYNRSYACYVLALAQRPPHGEMARLAGLGDQKNGFCRGSQINLTAAFAAAGKRREALEWIDRIGVASGVERLHELGGSLRSDVRNDAMLLSVLLDMDPQNARIPVLVKRLEAAQEKGRWCNTQDNAVALMAMGKYVRRLAAEQKPLAGRLIYGDNRSAEFSGGPEFRTAFQGGAVSIENRGEGPLCFYWMSEGVPIVPPPEQDNGVSVRRQLVNLDGSPVDVMRLKQGDLYHILITLTALGTLDNMVIEDLLPAGLEIENAQFKTSQQVKPIVRPENLLRMLHTDARDDRMLAFTASFSGTRSFSYPVRAVTVGEFVWPPASASCMYDPAVMSIHGGGRVRVAAENE